MNKTFFAKGVTVFVILAAVAVAVTVPVLGGNTDAVALLSLFYYANLILNMVFAWKKAPEDILMAVGLTLFFLCDTLIGFSFLGDYLAVPEGSLIDRINHPGFDLAWAFYLPSQMLLAISLFPIRRSQVNTREMQKTDGYGLT